MDSSSLHVSNNVYCSYSITVLRCLVYPPGCCEKDLHYVNFKLSPSGGASTCLNCITQYLMTAIDIFYHSKVDQLAIYYLMKYSV